MMEAARTSETLVKLYQTTRCYNPEDIHLHTHHCENLKSYLDSEMFPAKYPGVDYVRKMYLDKSIR
jgi:hypothetical protein